MVSIAMLMPIFAPALLLAAAIGISIATIAFIPYILNFFTWFHRPLRMKGVAPYSGISEKLDMDFISDHRAQLAIILLTAATFITALILTIGFFTGGAGFLFMAPIFSAISSPFAVAAASAHISLFLPALAGFCFVMAPLTIGNNLKRFLGWLDSFKLDALVQSNPSGPLYNSEDLFDRPNGGRHGEIPAQVRSMIKQEGYLNVISTGIQANITNGFSSPYWKKVEDQLALNQEKEEALLAFKRKIS
jgi:hypothetical protein